jgi:Ser/Thr protein kinase RdoA (MazF antagonist)
VTSRSALAASIARHLGARGVAVESPASTRVPTSLEVAAEFGAVLARFHSAVDDFEMPPGAAWTALSLDTLAGTDPTWLERLYADDATNRTALVRWWEQATGELGARGAAADVGLGHGEAYPATCRLVGAGAELTLSELDWAGTGDRAYDLATFRWVLEVHAPADAERRFAELVAGYAAVRPVPDLSGLRSWVAVRHLWSMRLAAGFADARGLAQRASFATSWPLG